jgi:hypothetical protein
VLPASHAPQVFDKRGDDGRPIGVIEEGMTIRVEDVLGDWLQVRHSGVLGWCKLRVVHGPIFVNVMIPAMQSHSSSIFEKFAANAKSLLHGASKQMTGVSKFWKGLQMWDLPRYYRMGDSLPDGAEIKVRLRPTLDAKIVGHVVKGQVVECWAVFGHWMQIKYDWTDAVWVPWRVKRSILTLGMRVDAIRSVAGASNDSSAQQRYFRGRLAKERDFGKWDVDFDDGVSERDIPGKNILGLEYTLLLNKLGPGLQIRLRNIVRESPVVLPDSTFIEEVPGNNEEDALVEEALIEGVPNGEINPKVLEEEPK